MRKFSSEEKLDAVIRHIENGQSYKEIADSLGINRSTVADWCRLYQTEGPLVFGGKPNQHYNIEFKKQAVEYYLSGKGSLRSICAAFKISSKEVLRRWVKLYNSHRLKASTGGRLPMAKGRNTTLEERIDIVKECIASGLNYNQTATEHNVSYQQVYQWVHKYNQRGIDGLKDNRGRRKPVEEMSEIEKLRAENRILKAQLERKELENLFLKKLDEIERRRF